MREKLYGILEPADSSNTIATYYGRAMTVIILVSILPLCFIDSNPVLDAIDGISVTIFIIDYLLRWSCADLKLNKGPASFLLYPFTPMAIIDLLSILPAFTFINPSWRLMRLTRLLRVMRVFRLVRYSKSLAIFKRVFKREKDSLVGVLGLAVAYIFISALVVFNVEPDTFTNLFDAIYWAVISLTTVGYGDLYPKTDIGRTVAMISSLVGVAVVAMPSAIITAGFMEELREAHEKQA